MQQATHSLTEAPQAPSPRDGAFSFALPMHVFEKADAPEGKKRRFGGICTTDGVDRQGERILQDGLEWGDFMENGWFNDNHSNKTADVLGYPDKTSLVTFKPGDILPDGSAATCNGTWVEGYLLNRPAADQIWDLAQSLQGTGRSLGFSVEGNIVKRTGPGNKVIAKAKIRNVAVTNCFAGDVVISGTPEAITRRHYSGPMVEIVLATGEKLAGTPNHPVLTDRGWVPLGLLDETLDRVGRRGVDDVTVGPTVVAHNVKHMPATLQEVFDAAAAAGGRKWVDAGSKPQFHGDGIADSQVDVVLIEGALRDGMDAAFCQKFGKGSLPASDKLQAFLARLGAGDELGARGLDASADFVGRLRARLSAFEAQFGRPTEHLGAAGSAQTALFQDGAQPNAAHIIAGGDDASTTAGDIFGNHGVGLLGVELLEAGRARGGDPVTLGDGADASRADAVFYREVDGALSPAISFSNLRSKRLFDFTGHVYNLETVHGWYEANSVTAHNCPVNTAAKLEILARSLEAIEAEETQKAMGGEGPPVPLADAVGTGMTAGRIIAKEALEGAIHDNAGPARKKKRRKKQTNGMSKAEAIGYLQRRAPGLGRADAERILALSKAGKNGEGSRGGKIIGHTRSGKPIYGEGHETYTQTTPRGAYSPTQDNTKSQNAFPAQKKLLQSRLGYSAQDHREAKEAHETHGLIHRDKAEKIFNAATGGVHGLGGGLSYYESLKQVPQHLAEKISEHHNAATGHMQLARLHGVVARDLELAPKAATQKSLPPAQALAHLQARLPGLSRAQAQKTLRITQALEHAGLI